MRLVVVNIDILTNLLIYIKDWKEFLVIENSLFHFFSSSFFFCVCGLERQEGRGF